MQHVESSSRRARASAAAALIVAAAAGAGTARAAPAKPLLQGTYEITRMRGADGKEIEPAKQLVGGDTVWGRMAMRFDGNKVTLATASLDRDGGRFIACEAWVTVEVVWARGGFTIAANVTGAGRVTAFKKLSKSEHDATDQHCEVSLQKGFYTVTPGAAPTVKSHGATLLLAASDEVDKIDWSKHVP
jgi:hypothetical protein